MCKLWCLHLVKFGHPECAPEERTSEGKMHLKVYSSYCFCGDLLAFLAPPGPPQGCVTRQLVSIATLLVALPRRVRGSLLTASGRKLTEDAPEPCLWSGDGLRGLEGSGKDLQEGRHPASAATLAAFCTSTPAPALASAAGRETSAVGRLGREPTLGALPAAPADCPQGCGSTASCPLSPCRVVAT